MFVMLAAKCLGGVAATISTGLQQPAPVGDREHERNARESDKCCTQDPQTTHPSPLKPCTRNLEAVWFSSGLISPFPIFIGIRLVSSHSISPSRCGSHMPRIPCRLWHHATGYGIVLLLFYFVNLSLSNLVTTFGSALPRDLAITWPMRN